MRDNLQIIIEKHNTPVLVCSKHRWVSESSMKNVFYPRLFATACIFLNETPRF